MRIFLLATALAAPAAPAIAATRNFGITDFTKVRVDGPYKVSFTSGVAPFARASGSGAALDRLTIEVRGDTLVVQNNKSGWGGYPGTDTGPEPATRPVSSARPGPGPAPRSESRAEAGPGMRIVSDDGGENGDGGMPGVLELDSGA